MSEVNGDPNNSAGANASESDENDLGITYHIDESDLLDDFVCLKLIISKNVIVFFFIES